MVDQGSLGAVAQTQRQHLAHEDAVVAGLVRRDHAAVKPGAGRCQAGRAGGRHDRGDAREAVLLLAPAGEALRPAGLVIGQDVDAEDSARGDEVMRAPAPIPSISRS